MGGVKVAVFGTSRSGKDYTTRDATKILSKSGILFGHISTISMVHEELDGHRLHKMPENEKKNVVKRVRDRMKDLMKNGHVFVDEHYCFPRTFDGKILKNGYYDEKLPYRNERGTDNRIYEEVFDESWLKNYNLVIYLKIDPHIIVERFHTQEGVKNNPFATYDDLHSWQMFEIASIQKICNKFNTLMYYAYDPKKSSEKFALIISEYLKSKISKVKTKSTE